MNQLCENLQTITHQDGFSTSTESSGHQDISNNTNSARGHASTLVLSQKSYPSNLQKYDIKPDAAKATLFDTPASAWTSRIQPFPD